MSPMSQRATEFDWRPVTYGYATTEALLRLRASRLSACFALRVSDLQAPVGMRDEMQEKSWSAGPCSLAPWIRR